jgi:hypothetical protein
MKIYFLSSQPCALSLNGVFLGTTDTFERSAQVSLSDKIYAQFFPAQGQPIGFFLTETICTEPPDGCEVYLLNDGIAVYAYDFPPSDLSLRPIAQKREGDCLATVYTQGKPQLSVECPQGFFNATLPPSFAVCELAIEGEYILLRSPNELALFNKECRLLLLEHVLEYSLQDGVLTAVLPLSDSKGHTAKCVWQLTDGGCKQTQFSLSAPTRNTPLLEELLPYAFFECILLQGDYSSFLHESVQADAEKIRAFLGEYIAVALTDSPTVCGLVRKKGERLFQVDYFSVEIADGKIADVKG